MKTMCQTLCSGQAIGRSGRRLGRWMYLKVACYICVWRAARSPGTTAIVGAQN